MIIFPEIKQEVFSIGADLITSVNYKDYDYSHQPTNEELLETLRLRVEDLKLLITKIENES